MVPLFKVFTSPNAAEAVAKTLASGYLGQGPRVEEFEAAFGQLVGAPEPPLSLNSCTTAIELALRLIGVRPGDVVISTPMTCTATNSPIVNLGARIAWADVDPRTGLIDHLSVRYLADKYYRSVKAIIAVDWGGAVCNYPALCSTPFMVVQDAAHNPFALSQYRGDYVAWSFQAIKHLTTGDGGALLTPPGLGLMGRGRLLRWYGLDRRSKASFRCEQDITEVGGKWHMNDIAATIGLANLDRTRWVVDQHRDNAEFFGYELRDVEGIGLPGNNPGSSWWLYTLLVPDRGGFIRFMADRGVECSPVHARNDHHTAFRAASVNPDEARPGVDYFASHEVAIPVHWALTDLDRDQIVSAVRAWSKRTAPKESQWQPVAH